MRVYHESLVALRLQIRGIATVLRNCQAQIEERQLWILFIGECMLSQLYLDNPLASLLHPESSGWGVVAMLALSTTPFVLYLKLNPNSQWHTLALRSSSRICGFAGIGRLAACERSLDLYPNCAYKFACSVHHSYTMNFLQVASPSEVPCDAGCSSVAFVVFCLSYCQISYQLL